MILVSETSSERLERIFQLTCDSPQTIRVIVFPPQRCRAIIGTSSIERTLMIGCETPGGMRSKFEYELVVGLYDPHPLLSRQRSNVQPGRAHAGMTDRVDALERPALRAVEFFHGKN